MGILYGNALVSQNKNTNVMNIKLVSDNAAWGSVSGDGMASKGMNITVKAIPSNGYYFDSWKESGDVVSEEKEYTFEVSNSRELLASFTNILIPKKWTSFIMPSDAEWVSIAYGYSRFVTIATADARSDKAAYSSDGISWSVITLPFAAQWSRIIYANNKFVAVCVNGTYSGAYSVNGVNWTSLSIGYNLYDVVYGNGKFVGINSEILVYSTDGVNWTKTNTGVSGSWTYLMFGNGIFVATSYMKSGSYAIYSTDGISWKSATLPRVAQYYKGAYGNGMFVCPIYKYNEAAYSSDGVNWKTAILPTTTGYWIRIVFGNGKFIALSSAATAAYSLDGVTWTKFDMPASSWWYDAVYGAGKFVAISRSGTAAYAEG